jgi:hypothetical protein
MDTTATSFDKCILLSPTTRTNNIKLLTHATIERHTTVIASDIPLILLLFLQGAAVRSLKSRGSWKDRSFSCVTRLFNDGHTKVQYLFIPGKSVQGPTCLVGK